MHFDAGVVFIILVALTFDFLNGFHDAANSIATVVSTRVLAPLMGAILGFLLMVTVTWIFRRWHPFKLDQLFRRLQLVSAGLYSLGHGGNDAQKTMGTKITKLQPFGGFCAETAGAITLFLATHLGIPVSTTHTITGAIIGVGATRRISAVKWGWREPSCGRGSSPSPSRPRWPR